MTKPDEQSQEKHSKRSIFRRFAHCTAEGVGSPWAFLAAAAIILAWGISGPIFRFSDTWQLVINTGTTIVTFLMVFLIQNTQNRDARAMHLKLDELIRALGPARTGLVDLEELEDEELDELQAQFKRLREHDAGETTAKLMDQVAQHVEAERKQREQRIAEKDHHEGEKENHSKPRRRKRRAPT